MGKHERAGEEQEIGAAARRSQESHLGRTVVAAARGGSGMLAGWDCVTSAWSIRVPQNVAELASI